MAPGAARADGAYRFRVTGERILLVEDDEHIGASLIRALSGSGYETRWVRLGADAETAVAEDRPDLVLLDLGLPDSDGLDVCRRIHATDPAATVVMLTARDEELDIVVGLDAGAADYVVKPFKLAELLARIRAQLRRPDLHPLERDDIAGLCIDTAARRAFLRDVEIELRPKEFDLLARLAADAGNAVTREVLMAEVWDEHWFGSTKTLDFHVAALRRKIDDPGADSRITTLRGVGYRLERP